MRASSAEDRELPTDEELMSRVARGSEEAFEMILDRHHKRILNLLYFLTGDRDTAQDLSQECFLRLLRAAPGYRPRAKLSTFLITIARHLAFDERAKAWSRRESLPEGLSARGPDPERDLQRRELSERLAAVLATLSEEDREALLLSEVGGLRYREIAGMAGVPEGTIASRKNRAIRLVRERWEGDAP